jgi:hypothetical protein
MQAVYAYDDRGACVEDETAAGSEATDALSRDTEAQSLSELSAAMSIGSCARVDEIGRIGNDEVERSAEILEKIAFDNLDSVNRIEGRIDTAVAKGLAVDIAEHDVHLPRKDPGGMQSSGAATRTYVEQAKRTGVIDRFQRLPYEAREAIGVRAEEDGIRLIGGKRRMHKDLAVKCREANGTANMPSCCSQGAGFAQMPPNLLGHIPAPEGSAPAEDLMQ